MAVCSTSQYTLQEVKWVEMDEAELDQDWDDKASTVPFSEKSAAQVNQFIMNSLDELEKVINIFWKFKNFLQL